MLEVEGQSDHAQHLAGEAADRDQHPASSLQKRNETVGQREALTEGFRRAYPAIKVNFTGSPGRDAIPITHEFLALLLGVQRQTVTIAAGRLQRAGLVSWCPRSPRAEFAT